LSVILGRKEQKYDPIESFPKIAFKKESDFEKVLAYLRQIKDY